jgi:hypothetical protein
VGADLVERVSKDKHCVKKPRCAAWGENMMNALEQQWLIEKRLCV